MTNEITWAERLEQEQARLGRDMTLDEMLALAQQHELTPAEIDDQCQSLVRGFTRWKPPAPGDRPNGLEVLAFHRGKWCHVKWSENHQMWFLGYGSPSITDGHRAFAPLPEKPDNADGFYDYKWGG